MDFTSLLMDFGKQAPLAAAFIYLGLQLINKSEARVTNLIEVFKQGNEACEKRYAVLFAEVFKDKGN